MKLSRSPQPPNGCAVVLPPQPPQYPSRWGRRRRATRGWLGLGQAEPVRVGAAESRRQSLHGCHSFPQPCMCSDCLSGLSLACRSGLTAAVRQRCRGKGAFLASGGEKGRETRIPTVGLKPLLRSETGPDNDARPVPLGRVGRRGAPLRGRCGSYNMLLQFALASRGELRLDTKISEQHSPGKQVGARQFTQASWGSQVYARYWRRARECLCLDTYLTPAT